MNTFRIESAPLQGYTDYIFRNLHYKYIGGIDAYYTPFVRYEHENFRNKDLRDISPENNRTPSLIPQLIASSPEELNNICKMLRKSSYKQADINMGCPFIPIVRRKKGSGILPYPDKVDELLKETLKFPEISFSVKTRLGWESPNECLQLLPIFHSYPLHHITLHARTGKQQYNGYTDITSFGSFYEQCKTPLLYNGDITSKEDAFTIKRQFPLIAGIAIGRGLLYNPFIAKEIKSEEISTSEKQQTMQCFHNEMLFCYQSLLDAEHLTLTKMKTFWEYFFPDADKKLRKKILKSKTINEYKQHSTFLLETILYNDNRQ